MTLKRHSCVECGRLPEQFTTLVSPNSDGCWVWIGPRDRQGYGRFGNRILAYRFVYEAMRGPVPEGLELDHLCRITSCVHPCHLEPVTHRENMLRGRKNVASLNARKKVCPKGHPLSGTNLLGRRGSTKRECKTCHRDRMAAKRRAQGIRAYDPSRCKNDHLRTSENTYIRPDKGTQMCRDCSRERRQGMVS